MNIGGNDITKAYLGDTEIKKIYLGSDLVYEKASALPYDAQVEYIRSTGVQWIDTGVQFNDNITFAISKIKRNDASAVHAFLGYRFVDTATATGNMRFFFLYADGRIGARFGAAANNSTMKMTSGSYHALYFNGTKLYLDTQSAVTVSSRYSTSSYGNIYLFACNTGEHYSADLNKFIGDLCDIRIVDNGTFVRDYIPVRKNGVGYLYDRVSGQLFGDGSGTGFEYGSDV